MRHAGLSALSVGLTLATSLLGAVPDLDAQDVEMRGRVNGIRPPAGYYDVLARDPNAYEFQRVWKEVARGVRERRQALAGAGDYSTLNSHFREARPSKTAAQASGVALSGSFRIPVLIGVFADSSNSFRPDAGTLNNVLFGTSAAPPYSVRMYYDELSNGLVEVIGDVIGWFPVDSTSAWYEGSNNGLSPATDNTGDYIVELLDAADAAGVDFSVYDRDTDGFIDLVAVLHPLQGGECGSSHIWSHRWVLPAWGKNWSADGVTAWDYMIQPAVGGSTGCDSTSVMTIGTVSHELGHGMADLPDLYDTVGNTSGIGVWGLMGSGNWNLPASPAHMMAWSKDDLGWIAVDAIDANAGGGTFALDPILAGHTAMRVNVQNSSEYFLLENRHRLGSDANLRGQGLLVWHITPTVILQRRGTNTVNGLEPHGVDLEQADGDDDLRNGNNGGDSGDPYPGATSNTVFGPGSTPSSELNDNSNSGLQVDNIQVNADRSVSFRVTFNIVEEVITTSVGPGTQVIVDGVSQDAPHRVAWLYPSSHTIAVDPVQGDTLSRYTFQSWNDGGTREHTVSIDATPDTFVATVSVENRLRAVADASGSITSSVPLDANGIVWLVPGTAVQLIAVPNPDFLFARWSGDTTAINDTLQLTVSRPYTLRAQFGTPTLIETGTLAAAVMGAAYVDTLRASGGIGEFNWSLADVGTLPAGLSLGSDTGVISGIPEEAGSFLIVVRAESGAIESERTVSLVITTPALLLDQVVNHLLSPVAVLGEDEIRFLDLIGNRNGEFDIGDFRAYLRDAGLVAGVSPAAVLETLDRSGNEGTAQQEVER
ncbi:MAG: M6 family metalloprotease domain-containing protein [Gemmatimonadota bacterium]|nr:MAG: M6 family metalloprotease domain-containing protein [Gemmatimonadota bacterium]